MANQYRIVENASGLALACYEEVPELLVTGNLGSSLYYAFKSMARLSVCIVLLFFCLFLAVSLPGLMIPCAIILVALIAMFSLPLIYLGLAEVPMSMVGTIKRKYKIVAVDMGVRELHLRLRDEAAKKKAAQEDGIVEVKSEVVKPEAEPGAEVSAPALAPTQSVDLDPAAAAHQGQTMELTADSATAAEAALASAAAVEKSEPAEAAEVAKAGVQKKRASPANNRGKKRGGRGGRR